MLKVVGLIWLFVIEQRQRGELYSFLSVSSGDDGSWRRQSLSKVTKI